MKIHRFISDFDLTMSELKIEGEIAHQIIKVLKLKLGEKLELSNGKNISAIALIKEMNKNSVLVKITELLHQDYTEQNMIKNITLFCAVLKKENFEMVVQKTTEVGVSKIIPIITSRTIKTGLKIDRLKKIAKEASELSGRVTVPEISEPISFTEAIEIANGENILFDISGSKFSNNYQLNPINLFIGPEGGWTDKEIELAKNNNFKIATLGTLTLRGETAAIVSTYLALNI